jgi:hypothetical protein
MTILQSFKKKMEEPRYLFHGRRVPFSYPRLRLIERVSLSDITKSKKK